MQKHNSIYINLSTPTTAQPVTVVQTTRGDYTDSLYGGFNLGLHVGDIDQTVHQNRATLLAQLQQEHPTLASIHWLNQVHGNHVHHVTDQLLAHTVAADAHITTLPNVALAIMTADCVPVMITSDIACGANNVIAAVHAGWQGLAKNVIYQTVQKMVHQSDLLEGNTDLEDIKTLTQGWQAWVGASIAQCNYEVDSRVRAQVLEALAVDEATDTAERLFKNSEREGHYFANLAAVAELQLNVCGIHQVFQSQLDSYGDPRFYSYRSQTQQQLPATGRMATLIFMAESKPL